MFFHRYSDGFSSWNRAKHQLAFFKTVDNIERVAVTNSGFVQFYSSNYLYFFGANLKAQEIAKRNYANYLKLSKTPHLKAMLAYEFTQDVHDGLSYYKMEKLQEIPRKEEIEATLALLNQIRVNQQILPLTSIIDFPHIIETLEKNFTIDLSRLYTLFNEWELLSCYMHGDPHFPNIMKNNKSEYVFIDLDRFREFGPAYYDQMFVAIILLRSRGDKSINWVTFVIKKLQDSNFHLKEFSYSKKELILFIILRIYLEDSSHLSPSRYFRYKKLLSLI